MTDVGYGHDCVQAAQRLASDRYTMRVQVAANQTPTFITESRETKIHTVAAAQVDYSSRSQVFGGKEFKYPIQLQLPSDELASRYPGLAEHFVYKADAVPQLRIGRRLPMATYHSRCNRPPDASDQNSQCDAANHPDDELLLPDMGASGCQGGQSQGLERAQAEETAQFHRRENNQGLKQWIIDESAGDGQRLIEFEE